VNEKGLKTSTNNADMKLFESLVNVGVNKDLGTIVSSTFLVRPHGVFKTTEWSEFAQLWDLAKKYGPGFTEIEPE
jgi:hypothetical protein